MGTTLSELIRMYTDPLLERRYRMQRSYRNKIVPCDDDRPRPVGATKKWKNTIISSDNPLPVFGNDIQSILSIREIG